MFDLVIRNTNIVRSDEILLDYSVGIKDGKIIQIGRDSEFSKSVRDIKADGKYLFPGMFDPHCHLGSGDERSYEYMRESFAIDTKDCLLGGVTSIATTTVLTSDPLDVNYKNTLEAASGVSNVNFKISCVVTKDYHAQQIKAAYQLGCTSFKFYTGYCGCLAEKMGMSPEGIPPSLFYTCVEEALNLPTKPLMMIHAEEPTVRFMLADRFKAAGKDSLLDWASHSPDWSESVQVYQYGVIAKQFNMPLYIVHISKAHTINFLSMLQNDGYPIIGETCVGFLSTTAHEMVENKIGIYGKIQPPIRYKSDQDVLWKAIRDGVVTSIGTDSIPYTSKYKDGQAFWNARPGLNIQTPDSMSLLLTEGFHKKRITLEEISKVTSELPAKHFGISHRKGIIKEGMDADLVLVDLEKEMNLGLKRYKGHNNYSLWEGKKVKGAVVSTILGGEVVVENDEIVSGPRGQHLGNK
jgi:dihydroorotase-like cyclic amidohydrolase